MLTPALRTSISEVTCLTTTQSSSCTLPRTWRRTLRGETPCSYRGLFEVTTHVISPADPDSSSQPFVAAVPNTSQGAYVRKRIGRCLAVIAHKLVRAAKEALSKFSTPVLRILFIYNLAEFHAIALGIWKGSFTILVNTKARVWVGSSYAMSFVLPIHARTGERPLHHIL